MTNSDNDTIAAVATPPGRGGIAIVRVSGALVGNIASALFGNIPRARTATFVHVRDDAEQPLDDGLALYFPAPHSFTGEDVLELHGHGGPVIADMMLERVLQLGARQAEPGEFSQRAFLNDKMDLAQAEALADLIDSGSKQAARAALRSLRGEFSERVNELSQEIVRLRTFVEAAIDFPEEELDVLADEKIVVQLDGIAKQLAEIRQGAQQGCLLRDGMTVVIAGKPNAGKSSLLNRLAGYDAAIVTHIPGTTRDVVRERITVDGLPLHVLDTAGLTDATDVVEKEGVRRARDAIASADRILLVVDTVDTAEDTADNAAAEFGDMPVTVIRNKIDLSGEPAGIENESMPPVIRISAKTGAGLDELRGHLKACVGFQAAGTGTLSARRRHVQALDIVDGHVEQARHQLVKNAAGELMAEELRLAHRALGEITGEFTTEDLLGSIFSTFCIGK